MRFIKNGRLYDTDTAKHLATWDNGVNAGDLDYFQQDLYIKHTGEYYVCNCGSRGYGYAVTPMTEAEARTWCETHCSTDTYIRIWGTPGK